MKSIYIERTFYYLELFVTCYGLTFMVDRFCNAFLLETELTCINHP